MGFLGDFLGGVGAVLSAPKNLLYQHVISPLAGRQVNNFGDLIGNDEDTGFAGHALGFLGDMLTDPMSYAGGFLASGLRNKALRGASTLGKAGEEATGLATNAVMKSTGEATPVLWGARLEQGAPGLAPGEGTSGLTKLLSNPGGEAAGGLSLAADLSPASEALGQRTLVSKADKLRNYFENAPEAVSQSASGLYHPESSSILTRLDRPELLGGELTPGADQALSTLRHERFHSLVDRGVKDAASRDQLPAMARMASSNLASGNSLRQGFGEMLNEMGAHAAESRSTLGQIRNATRFLFDPTVNSAGYQAQIAGYSPLVAGLYGTLPATIPMAGAFGMHGLTSLGGR